MQKFNGSLVRQFPSLVTGNAGAGVSVTVYAGDTGSTLATLFSGNGTGSLSNPLTTDSAGYYAFYAADGVYRLNFGLPNIPDQLIQLVDVAEIRADFDDIESSNAAFLVEQQANYDAFVLSQGWDQVGTFAAGFTYTSPNQVGQDTDGNWWRWNGALPKVVTAGTLPSSDTNYKLVGDGVLRSDLAATDSTVLVGGAAAALIGSRASKWAVVTDPAFSADNTGSVFATDAFMAAQASSDFIVVPPGVYRIDPSDPVVIMSNKTWFFMGSLFTKPPGAGQMFSAVSVSDFNLIGSAILTGNATESNITNNTGFTGEAGLLIDSCLNFKVGDFSFKNIAGYGLKMTGAVSPSQSFGQRGTFENISASLCHYGIDMDAGNGSEYNTFNNYDLSANRVGLRMGAGNNVFGGGVIAGNRYTNVWLTGGANNGHGSMVATTINHGGVYNLLAEDVTVGFTFGDCQWFGNFLNNQSGQIFIRNSEGVTIDGGILDCWVTVWKASSTGYNSVRNMWCPGGYGKVKLDDDLESGKYPQNLLVSGCYGEGSRDAVTGASINSKDCETVLVRGPTNGQILTADVYTALQWPTADNVLTDNRRAWDSSANIFVVPMQMGGVYSISGRITLQTTGTIDIKTTRARIIKNGSPLQLFRAYSKDVAADDTDICSIDINSEALLADGDVLRFEVNQSGTGIPIWADPDGQQVLTITKRQ